MAQILSELGIVIFHTFVIYLFLVLAMSLIGHRQSAELSITELAVIMVVGSAVETAMVAGDTSLQAGLISAATLLVSNRVMTLLIRRWVWLRRFIIGRPIPLVYRGDFLHRRIDEAGLTEEDVLEGIREMGFDDIHRVRLAVLEINGAISVIPEKTHK